MVARKQLEPEIMVKMLGLSFSRKLAGISPQKRDKLEGGSISRCFV
jgi:hypothetical protein